MRTRITCALLLGGCATGIGLWSAIPVHGASDSSTSGPGAWNRQAAATYLDSREVWWQGWPRAQKDHGTLCISCHTVVPYAMARPALSHELSETGMSPTEKTMFDSVEKRVSMWSEMVPFYSDANNGPGKTAQAHSTEAVLNAVVLASYDSREGHLRPITRKAFDYAWALQLNSGAAAGGWLWQDFHLAPWESNQSAYQGAALLAVEVGEVEVAKLGAAEPRGVEHLDDRAVAETARRGLVAGAEEQLHFLDRERVAHGAGRDVRMFQTPRGVLLEHLLVQEEGEERLQDRSGNAHGGGSARPLCAGRLPREEPALVFAQVVERDGARRRGAGAEVVAEVARLEEVLVNGAFGAAGGAEVRLEEVEGVVPGDGLRLGVLDDLLGLLGHGLSPWLGREPSSADEEVSLGSAPYTSGVRRLGLSSKLARRSARQLVD